ncbi:HAD family hydrolase [Aeromicrobium sp. CF4.19]|uniref:HAD family hydrolase n=1 Tax=Aeromicrobium sp. CF4.19 TaxID=3373082 RepID=UPI003EE44200
MRRPALLATDLDGTLLRSDGSLSTRTRAAIAAADEAGLDVVFVTARPPRWLHDLADAVGGHGVALCGNGAFVYDVARRHVVEARPFAAAALHEITADLRAAIPSIAFAVECADGERREEHFVDRYEDEYATGELYGAAAGKLLARAADLDHDAFLERVTEVVAGRAELGFSGAVGLAELTAAGVTKASGLAAWCEERGIGAEEVWACGDMPNDLPMLEWAGRSLAVANAHTTVLAAADEVIASNDDDGVAAVLEQVTAPV